MCEGTLKFNFIIHNYIEQHLTNQNVHTLSAIGCFSRMSVHHDHDKMKIEQISRDNKLTLMMFALLGLVSWPIVVALATEAGPTSSTWCLHHLGVQHCSDYINNATSLWLLELLVPGHHDYAISFNCGICWIHFHYGMLISPNECIFLHRIAKYVTSIDVLPLRSMLRSQPIRPFFVFVIR